MNESSDVLPRSVCVTDGTVQLFGAFVGSGRGESCTVGMIGGVLVCSLTIRAQSLLRFLHFLHLVLELWIRFQKFFVESKKCKKKIGSESQKDF